MKFGAIFRFEFAYQTRRVAPWLCFVLLLAFAFWMMVGPELTDDAELLNSPFAIAFVTVLGGAIWLLTAASVAGEAAARDVQTLMYPLTYTAPVSKATYLGGRFLAAFVLNALLLLAVPAGLLLALFVADFEAARLGPFRPAAYLTAYGFIALPFAFVATAIQFAWATLNRRSMASYLASVLLFITSHFVLLTVAQLLGRWELVRLLDLIGFASIAAQVGDTWTALEKNMRLVGLEGWLLMNRLIWLAIALGALAFTYCRFRLAHPVAHTWPRLRWRRRDTQAAGPAANGIEQRTPLVVPQVRQTFGFATATRQMLAIAWISCRAITQSRAGLAVVVLFALHLIVFMPEYMQFLGIPLFPVTEHILGTMTAPLDDLRTPLIIIPLLIAYSAGELVWRERDAGVSDIADATPVPEWALFLGKFLGLGLVLVVWLALLATAGMLAQLAMGYRDLEVGLYLQILFGLQLPEYLLFACLALVVHALVSQKYLGHLVVLLVLGFIGFAPRVGIEHKLLIYGAGPAWSYTEMRGFGPFLWPWLWFKLYWVAWALLLAVSARLLWVRDREGELWVRLRLACGRLTRPTIGVAATAAGFILLLGGFIFYNTNVLNDYRTSADRAEAAAEYERRYRQYADTPQPLLTATKLNVEIYPERRAVAIRGTYRLVNRRGAPIDTIHLATVPEVQTSEVVFDRPATRMLADDALGHGIYALAEPLQPGDAITLRFAVDYAPHGFRNDGIDALVVANGTFFNNRDWLPAIGYQPNRELRDIADRRVHGLSGAPSIPGSLYDPAARQYMGGAELIDFAVVVGTDADQVAIAPGSLRRTWTEGGRRYFHYAADAPIRNEYAFFSADYALHEAWWNDPAPPGGTRAGQVVAIQIFHHPQHTAGLDRMVRSIQASLTHYTAEFGPYPYRHIRFIEQAGGDGGMSADASSITYEEGFAHFNPGEPARALDLPFYIVAHEVAHQWWGSQLASATVEGGWLMSESLAVYSGMQVLREAYGQDQVRRYLGLVRSIYEFPRTRAAVPLLRADNSFLGYRKGAIALYALSRYIGEARVNGALRRLLEKHPSAMPPLSTSLDLYRELQAVTPASFHSLLYDLFEANTFWELKTEQATAAQTADGNWQVTLDVRARKVVVDEAGLETAVSMDDWVEIGVFAPIEKGESSGKPLYLQMHHIASGQQTITVTVPQKPAYAGIDPEYLLIDLNTEDNITAVTVAR